MYCFFTVSCSIPFVISEYRKNMNEMSRADVRIVFDVSVTDEDAYCKMNRKLLIITGTVNSLLQGILKSSKSKI